MTAYSRSDVSTLPVAYGCICVAHELEMFSIILVGCKNPFLKNIQQRPFVAHKA